MPDATALSRKAQDTVKTELDTGNLTNKEENSEYNTGTITHQ